MDTLKTEIFKKEPSLAGAAEPKLGEPPDRQVFPGRLPTLRQIEDLLVQEALRRAGGNQAIAAMMLGISRQALNKRLKKTAP